MYFLTLLILCLILFLDFPVGLQPMRVLSLIARAIFLDSDWLFEFCNRHSDWLNFIHFTGNKLKNKLILRLIKTEDLALISIFTILKFSALIRIRYSSFSL